MTIAEGNVVYTFTDEKEKELNSISILKKEDAHYIRGLLMILYKQDIKALHRRSYSGQTRTRKEENRSSEPKQPFKPISPMKKMVIFDKFAKRITGSSIPKQQQLQRLDNGYIVQLISWGIANIRNANKKM